MGIGYSHPILTINSVIPPSLTTSPSSSQAWFNPPLSALLPFHFLFACIKGQHHDCQAQICSSPFIPHASFPLLALRMIIFTVFCCLLTSASFYSCWWTLGQQESLLCPGNKSHFSSTLDEFFPAHLKLFELHMPGYFMFCTFIFASLFFAYSLIKQSNSDPIVVSVFSMS